MSRLGKLRMQRWFALRPQIESRTAVLLLTALPSNHASRCMHRAALFQSSGKFAEGRRVQAPPKWSTVAGRRTTPPGYEKQVSPSGTGQYSTKEWCDTYKKMSPPQKTLLVRVRPRICNGVPGPEAGCELSRPANKDFVLISRPAVHYAKVFNSARVKLQPFRRVINANH